MLNPYSLNATFGLAKIQEEYVLSCKKNSKLQQESSEPSILGLPKVNNFVEAKLKFLLNEYFLLKSKKERRKDYVTIEMKNRGLGISVRVLRYSFLKA